MAPYVVCPPCHQCLLRLSTAANVVNLLLQPRLAALKRGLKKGAEKEQKLLRMTRKYHQMCWGVKQLDAVNELTSLFAPRSDAGNSLMIDIRSSAKIPYLHKYTSLLHSEKPVYIVWTSTATSNPSLAIHQH